MATHLSAIDILPLSTAKNIARGIVWVLPGILPAIINVAPNSPIALAKDNTKPAIIPGQARGIAIL